MFLPFVYEFPRFDVLANTLELSDFKIFANLVGENWYPIIIMFVIFLFF